MSLATKTCDAWKQVAEEARNSSQNGSAPRRATKQCLGLVLNVCYWHLADVPLALTNVCFEGKNGHDAHAPLCRLMTQSGHTMPIEQYRN